MHIIRLIILLGICMSAACSKKGASYESRFPDEITLEFPSGILAGDGELIRQRMDKSLRASKAGFVSGMMSSGKEIDFISFHTDFEQVDEEALLKGLIDEGTLPRDVKASYERGENKPAEGESPKRP